MTKQFLKNWLLMSWGFLSQSSREKFLNFRQTYFAKITLLVDNM
jgi:hypothetical protein